MLGNGPRSSETGSLQKEKLPASLRALSSQTAPGGILEAWPKIPKQPRANPDGSPIGRSVVLGQQGELAPSPPSQSPPSPDAPPSPATSHEHRASWPLQLQGASRPASAEDLQRRLEPTGSSLKDPHLLPPSRKQQPTYALGYVQPKPPSIHPYAANGALALNQRLNRHRQRKSGTTSQTMPSSSTPAAPAARNAITQPESGAVSAWVSSTIGHPHQGEVPGRVPGGSVAAGGLWGLRSKGPHAQQVANGDGGWEGLVGGEADGAVFLQRPRRGRLSSPSSGARPWSTLGVYERLALLEDVVAHGNPLWAAQVESRKKSSSERGRVAKWSGSTAASFSSPVQLQAQGSGSSKSEGAPIEKHHLQQQHQQQQQQQQLQQVLEGQMEGALALLEDQQQQLEGALQRLAQLEGGIRRGDESKQQQQQLEAALRRIARLERGKGSDLVEKQQEQLEAALEHIAQLEGGKQCASSMERQRQQEQLEAVLQRIAQLEKEKRKVGTELQQQEQEQRQHEQLETVLQHIAQLEEGKGNSGAELLQQQQQLEAALQRIAQLEEEKGSCSAEQQQQLEATLQQAVQQELGKHSSSLERQREQLDAALEHIAQLEGGKQCANSMERQQLQQQQEQLERVLQRMAQLEDKNKNDGTHLQQQEQGTLQHAVQQELGKHSSSIERQREQLDAALEHIAQLEGGKQCARSMERQQEQQLMEAALQRICKLKEQVAAEKAEREAAVAAVAKAMEAALVARDVQQACAMEDLQATVKALARTQEQNRLQAETKSGAEAPPAAQPRQQKGVHEGEQQQQQQQQGEHESKQQLQQQQGEHESKQQLQQQQGGSPAWQAQLGELQASVQQLEAKLSSMREAPPAASSPDAPVGLDASEQQQQQQQEQQELQQRVRHLELQLQQFSTAHTQSQQPCSPEQLDELSRNVQQLAALEAAAAEQLQQLQQGQKELQHMMVTQQQQQQQQQEQEQRSEQQLASKQQQNTQQPSQLSQDHRRAPALARQLQQLQLQVEALSSSAPATWIAIDALTGRLEAASLLATNAQLTATHAMAHSRRTAAARLPLGSGGMDRGKTSGQQNSINQQLESIYDRLALVEMEAHDAKVLTERVELLEYQATMGTLAPEATPSSEENSVAELQQQQEQQIHQEQEQQLLLLQQQQQQQEQSQQLLPSAFGRHMLNPKRMSTGTESLDRHAFVLGGKDRGSGTSGPESGMAVKLSLRLSASGAPLSAKRDMLHRVSSGGNVTNSVRAMNAGAASDRKSQLHRSSSQGQGRYELQSIEDQLLALEARVFRLEDYQASPTRSRGSPARDFHEPSRHSGALLSHSSEPQTHIAPLSQPPPPALAAPSSVVVSAAASQAAPHSPTPQPVLSRRLLWSLLARLEALEGSSSAIWITSDVLTAQLHTLQQQLQQQQQQQHMGLGKPSAVQPPMEEQGLQGQESPSSSTSTPEVAAKDAPVAPASAAYAAAGAQPKHRPSCVFKVSLDAEPGSSKPGSLPHRVPQRACSAADLSASGRSWALSNQSSMARGFGCSKHSSFRAYNSFTGGDQDGHLNVGRLAMLLDVQHSQMVCLEERLEAVENRQSSNSGAVHQLLDELAAAAADQEGADKGIGSVTELYDLPEGSRASSLRRPHALDLLRFNSRSSHAQSNTRKRSMSISGTSPSARVKWQEEDDKHEDGTSSKGHDAKSLRSNKSERSASDLEMAGGISETDEQQLSRHTPPRGSAAAAAAAAAGSPAASQVHQQTCDTSPEGHAVSAVDALHGKPGLGSVGDAATTVQQQQQQQRQQGAHHHHHHHHHHHRHSAEGPPFSCSACSTTPGAAAAAAGPPSPKPQSPGRGVPPASASSLLAASLPSGSLPGALDIGRTSDSTTSLYGAHAAPSSVASAGALAPAQTAAAAASVKSTNDAPGAQHAAAGEGGMPAFLHTMVGGAGGPYSATFGSLPSRRFSAVGDTGLANDQTPAANKRLTMAAAMSSRSLGSPTAAARTNLSSTAHPENKPPPFFSSKSARFSSERSIDASTANALAAAAASASHGGMRPSNTGASTLEGAPHAALHDGGSVVGVGGASAYGGDDAADETRSTSGKEDMRSAGAANSTKQLYETQKMMVELARRQNKIGDQVVKLEKFTRNRLDIQEKLVIKLAQQVEDLQAHQPPPPRSIAPAPPSSIHTTQSTASASPPHAAPTAAGMSNLATSAHAAGVILRPTHGSAMTAAAAGSAAAGNASSAAAGEVAATTTSSARLTSRVSRERQQ